MPLFGLNCGVKQSSRNLLINLRSYLKYRYHFMILSICAFQQKVQGPRTGGSVTTIAMLCKHKQSYGPVKIINLIWYGHLAEGKHRNYLVERSDDCQILTSTFL